MHRGVLASVLACSVFCFATLRAEDAPPKPNEAKPADKEKKKEQRGPERAYPRGPEVEKLKTDLGMSDEQIKLAKDAVAAVTKKNDELMANKDVAAAEEEVKKAKEALKVAEDKAKAAKDNFDLNEEYKKAVLSAVPEDKKAKAAELLHLDMKPKKEKKDEAKATPAVAPPAPPAANK